MKEVSKHLPRELALLGGQRRAVLEQLLEDLGDLEDGGLTITLQTTEKLEAIERPEVTQRADGRTYVCMCGWETDNVEKLVVHLRKHGATRLIVTPENWKPR